jgi:hypothetical protein
MVEEDRRHPLGGVDYPRTLQEFDEWFPSERACVEYLERIDSLVGWISMPCVRRRICMAVGPRPVTMHEMPAPDVSNGRDHIPRYPQATSDVVPDDVVCDKPEAWSQRSGFTTRPWAGQLPDCLGLAAQVATRHGTTPER